MKGLGNHVGLGNCQTQESDNLNKNLLLNILNTFCEVCKALE